MWYRSWGQVTTGVAGPGPSRSRSLSSLAASSCTSSPRASSVSATMASSPTAAEHDCSPAAGALSASLRIRSSNERPSQARTTSPSSTFCPRASASAPTVGAVRCGASKCSDAHLRAISGPVVSQPDPWPRPSGALHPSVPASTCATPHPSRSALTSPLPSVRRPRATRSLPSHPAASTAGLFNPHSPTHRVAAQPN